MPACSRSCGAAARSATGSGSSFRRSPASGRSWISQQYSIVSLEEARAYLADPILGARLRECAATILATKGRTADEIFGSLDAMKVRSCMTLFHRAAPDEPLFQQVLDLFYEGIPDAYGRAGSG